MVAVGNHEYTHLPSLVVTLTSPAAANQVQYSVLPAGFGPQLAKWRTSSGALAGQVVRAGGNYFKGANLTDDLCLYALPDAEQLVQGRLLYKVARVVWVCGVRCFLTFPALPANNSLAQTQTLRATLCSWRLASVGMHAR